MAVFNPQVQGVETPNYAGYTRPVEGALPDKSAGMALAALGESLSAGVKLADSTIKEVIGKDIEGQVDVARNEYTSSLEQARAVQQGNVVAAAPQSLMDANASMDVPPSLQVSLGGIDKLSEARKAGKINDTYYTQQLNSIAKNVRNQYPGHRDFIDEKIKQTTGMDPANAYYKNLLQDINATNAASKDNKDAVLKALQQNVEIPGAVEYIMGYKQGLINEENAWKFLNKNQSEKYKYDQWKREREGITAVKEDDKSTAEEQFRTEIGGSVARRFDMPFTMTGLNSPSTMSRLIQDVQEGRQPPLSAEQNEQVLQTLTSTRRTAYAEGVALAKKKGYDKFMDPKKINEMVEANLQPWDHTIEAVKNKEYGTAFGNARMIDGIVNDTSVQLFQEKDIGQYNRLVAAVTKNAGPQNLNLILGQGLISGQTGKFENYVKQKLMKSVVPDDVRKDGTIKSLYSDIADAQQKKIPVTSNVYNNLMDNIDNITDSSGVVKDNTKIEIAKYAFNPANNKILDSFQKDYTDPTTGKQVQGKYSVFSRLTKEDITNNVWSISKKEPTVWKDYKNWAENSFSRLYGEEIKTLNDLQNEGSVKMNIGWDADNKRFSIMGEGGRPPKATTNTDQLFLNNANGVVNRLNSGLSSLGKVQDKEGTDTSAYLLKTMLVLGYRPGENTTGLPQQITNAIASSKKSSSKRFEDTFR